MPGVPAAGHIAGGFWHPGRIDGCPKCSTRQATIARPAPASTREPFYVKRTQPGRVGYVGPLPWSRADREADAWHKAGWDVALLPATPENHRIVNDWQRDADIRHGRATAVDGTCWNCAAAALVMRPDPAMRNLTDEVICTECQEVQPDA
jgi:hypothetical protein